SLDDVARLVSRALKVTAKADAGLFGRSGVRAGLPAGALLRGQLLDAVPGSERVVLVDVPGEVLTKLVSHPDAVLELPSRIDPLSSYVLATTASLYREGIGLTAVDANPVDTRALVGPSLEAWLAGEATSPAHPLTLPTKRRR
ncbi:MAG: 5'-nucleotidase C-terminal domain-containing protein, partial [Myxococcaceae bacterium]|nr:5'-nucleotidase C-terminal domain-containing protein [Myxococcaceae bacterium]